MTRKLQRQFVSGRLERLEVPAFARREVEAT
jgi:hypothetical protein